MLGLLKINATNRKNDFGIQGIDDAIPHVFRRRVTFRNFPHKNRFLAFMTTEANSFFSSKAFFTKLACVSIIIFVIAKLLPHMPLWFAAFGLLVFSIPIALSLSYISTAKQIRHLSVLHSDGTLFRLISSRRLLRNILSLILAIGLSCFTIIQLARFSTLEWLILVVLPFIYLACHWQFLRLFQKEVQQKYIQYAWAVRSAGWCSAALTGLIYGLCMTCLGEVEAFATPVLAIDARHADFDITTSSNLIREVLEWSILSDGVWEYFIMALPPDFVRLLLFIGSGFAVSYSLVAFMTCCLLPLGEFKRVFSSLADSEYPPAISTGRIALISAVMTIFVAFIYVPFLGALESHTQPITTLRKVVARPALEKIGNEYFQRGTIKKIQDLQLLSVREIDLASQLLEEKIDGAFNLMVGNVDAFLNWYYSLTAEYGRTFQLLTGSIEQDMSEKLDEYLKKGDPMGQVNVAVTQLGSGNAEAFAKFKANTEAILKESRVIPVSADVDVIETRSVAEMFSMPKYEESVGIHSRLAGAGGVAAFSSAIVAKKIAAKVLGKSTFKLAAKAAAKMATSKASGAIGGMAAGAAVGSVVPVLGTIAGAVVGAIGGLVLGVGTDYALLAVEEKFDREDFKNEIVKSINEHRNEMKLMLKPVASKPL